MTPPTLPDPDAFPTALLDLAGPLHRAAASAPDLTLLVVLIHRDPAVGALMGVAGQEPGQVEWRPVPGAVAGVAVGGAECQCPACQARLSRHRPQA